MKSLKRNESTMPTGLPAHERGARRRRSVAFPAPSATSHPHSIPHKPSTRVTDDAATLLSTYSQFTPQGSLHE